MAPSDGLHAPGSGLAFIFDMDGVMIDSNAAHRLAWEAYNRRFGLETTENMHQRMYGKRNDEIVRDFFGDLPPGEIAARGAAKETLYREMIGERIESMLVPGLRQFLERYAVVPKAVASNAEPANIQFLLERAGLRPYFRVVVDGHQVRHPKPDPEVYLRAAALLGVPAAACIVFEDSYPGVAAGMAAGMRVVGILTTHTHLPGATLSVHNFLSGDLQQWLRAQDWPE
ncbi:MAG TPA: HAD-IA family hydrolase [Bryobacteraceae bacterium]|nr:HAD-IA family hydrolase [Bryobacteraceae bacterium]